MLKRKYREIYYIFQYQLVKNLIMVKQLRTDEILLIALDLCRPYYQVLLIICLKFTTKNVEIKTVNQHAILLGLTIIHYVTNAKNIKKSS